MPVATEEVYGKVSIEGENYRIVYGGSSGTDGTAETETGLKYENDRYNTAGKLGVTILSDTEIPEQVPVDVSIRGTPLFSGTILKSAEGITDRVRIEAFDGVMDLKRNTLTASYDRAPIADVANDALAEAGLAGDVNLPPIQVSPELDNVRCDKVLEKVARWGDGAWWVDATNTVIVTDEIAGEVDSHDLSYIKDASPGKRTPAYQSVRVEGASAVSRRGLDYRYLLSSQPIVATEGSGDPTYRFRDNDIQTQEQADKVAKQIYRKLQQQQKTGWVEVVGDESIRPFDDVSMPPDLGGESYLVSGVKQTLGERNGFVTRIQLGGLIRP